MNGPTPIISSMLNSTAARSPMRLCRWAVLSEDEEVGIMRLARSPDCTLASSMVFVERVHRAAVSAALAGLLLSASIAQLHAQQRAAQAALPASAPSSL